MTWHSISITAALIALAHVLGFWSAIHALMSVRTPQGTVAWVVSLITFPYVAVPAYWILGRSRFHGYVSVRQTKDAMLRERASAIARELQTVAINATDEHGDLRAATRMAKMPMVGGNDVELLIDGEATFASIFRGIEQAHQVVLVQFFIVHDDRLGRELKSLLIAKAKQGVQIHLLYDEIGSHDLPSAYVLELRDAGVLVQPFHSTRGKGNRFQLNFRNHRKIVVVDGVHGWLGGHNVGDEYLGRSKRFGHWRDTHIRVTGPAVLGLQLSFVEDWHWATGRVLDLPWPIAQVPGGGLPVLILPSGPADPRETASLMFQQAIHGARRRIWIASPYFVPDESVASALLLASLRGVEVRILIPDMPDHLLVYQSSFAFAGTMLKAGIEMHRYRGGFLHQKVVLVDDRMACVSTANLDNRSCRLNFEVSAIVPDTGFAARVEKMLQDDFAQAHRMSLEELDAMPLWRKVAARAAYLTAPIQ
jgi:cardiolipin synthase